MSNHDQLSGHGNLITNDCSGDLNFTNVELNWSGFTDSGGHILNVDTDSHLHLHQPLNIDYASANIDGNGWIEGSFQGPGVVII